MAIEHVVGQSPFSDSSRTIQTLVEMSFLVLSTSIDNVVNSHEQQLERVRAIHRLKREATRPVGPGRKLLT